MGDSGVIESKLDPMHIAFRSIMASMALEARCNQLIKVVEQQAVYTRKQDAELGRMKKELSQWNVTKLVGQANETYLERFRNSEASASAILDSLMCLSPEIRSHINDAITELHKNEKEG